MPKKYTVGVLPIASLRTVGMLLMCLQLQG